MSDVDDDEDDGAEGETTVKITPPKRAPANGTSTRAPSNAQLSAFGSAIAASGRELNVERVRGPNGKDVYARRTVQLGMLPYKLPPEATDNLVQAIQNALGGGWYKVWPDNAQKHEILYPIKVPGRPKPLDAAQAADEEAEAEQNEAFGTEPLPHLNGGSGGDFRLPPSDPFGGSLGSLPPSIPPGYTWDPVMRRLIPITPYHDPHSREIEKERDELKRKVELDPLLRKVEKLEDEKARGVAPSEPPLKGVIEMIQLQQAEAERNRNHQLTVEREERQSRRDREEEERKAKAAADAADRKYREERDREDRKEREAQASKMFELMITSSNNLVKIMTQDVAKKNADPIDGMVKIISVMQGAKDLTSPAPKSEIAEITEAVTSGSKEVIGAVGDIFAKRAAAANAPGVANAPKDEQLQMLDVLEYMTNLAKTGKIKPRDAFTAVCAFSAGRGYDQGKIIENLAKLAGREEIAKLAADLKEKSNSSLVPENLRPQLAEASNMLEQEPHAVWLLEVAEIAKS